MIVRSHSSAARCISKIKINVGLRRAISQSKIRVYTGTPYPTYESLTLPCFVILNKIDRSFLPDVWNPHIKLETNVYNRLEEQLIGLQLCEVRFYKWYAFKQ